MKVLGVDISTKKISAVSFDGAPSEGWEVEIPGKLAEDRFSRLTAAFAAYLRAEGPDVVYVEGLPFVKNRDAIVGLASVLGAVRGACAIYGIRCVTVPGHLWKKTLGIGASKDKVAAWCSERGHEFRSQDLIDAYAIAEYGATVESIGQLSVS